jgi:hypothetical protein
MMKPLIVRDEPIDNLQISEDMDGDKSLVVLLYTPTMRNTNEHFHVELDRSQAEALHQWLREYLERSSS